MTVREDTTHEERGMTLREFAERVWRVQTNLRKAEGDDTVWRVYISRWDSDTFKLSPDLNYPNDPDRSTIFGIPILVDEGLKPGEVVLRTEVRA